MGLFTDPAAIDAAAGVIVESPIVAQIDQICGHLEWMLDDEAKPALFREKRPPNASDESLDPGLYDAIRSIRGLATGETSQLHGMEAADCALLAVDAIAKGLPKRVVPDHEFAGNLKRLRKLLEELRPRNCGQCGGQFIAGYPDECWCHPCRTGRDRLGEIWRALISYWDSGQQVRIHDQQLWDQFCAAFKQRFGVLPKMANAGWSRNRKLPPSEDLPPIWEEFEAFCRERLRASGTPEAELRRAFHRTPISEAVKWMLEADDRLKSELSDGRLSTPSDAEPPIPGLDALFHKVVAFSRGRESAFQEAIRRWCAKQATGDANREALFPDYGAYYEGDERFVMLGAFHDSHPLANKRISPWVISPWDSDAAPSDPIATPYVELVRNVGSAMDADDLPVFEGLLHEVRDDVTATPKPDVAGNAPAAPDAPANHSGRAPDAAAEERPARTVRPKKSTANGDARDNVISALTLHHKYADGGSLNVEPIGVRKLARLAKVSPSVVSEFFNEKFNKGNKRGHAKYQNLCTDAAKLIPALKMLNGEYSPGDLYGGEPPEQVARGKRRGAGRRERDE